MQTLDALPKRWVGSPYREMLAASLLEVRLLGDGDGDRLLPTSASVDFWISPSTVLSKADTRESFEFRCGLPDVLGAV